MPQRRTKVVAIKDSRVDLFTELPDSNRLKGYTTFMPDLSHDRPDVIQEDGKIYLRASSFGGCIKRLIYSGQGYAKSQLPRRFEESLAKAFEFGRTYESLIVERINEKTPVTETQWQFQYEVAPDVFITGHIDGIVEIDGKIFILEIKTTNSQSFRKYLDHQIKYQNLLAEPTPFPQYRWQTSIYYHAWNKEHPDNQVHGVVISMNQKRDGGIGEFINATIPIYYGKQTIAERALMIKEELQKEAYDVTSVSCDVENKFGCPYNYLHDGEKTMTDPIFTEYARISNRISTMEKRKAELREEIINLYVDDPRAKEGFETKYGVLKINRNKDSETLDTTALKAKLIQDGVDIKPFMKPKAGAVVITVVKPKEEA